ncbi:uncharacterized protein [Argopecten irradians]|uniref:uncharacterized protein n=1 Tax=Argopecten irradians TaxID=31199 RepID=UPI00371CF086
MNDSIATSLRSYCNEKQSNWHDILPSIMLSYRAVPSTQSTQFSPYFLLFGRECRLPIDTVLTPTTTVGKSAESHLAKIIENHETFRQLAKDNVRKAQAKYKKQHDKNAKNPDFRIGERVWLHCKRVPIGLSPKLCQKWVGPFYITNAMDNHRFKIRNCQTHKVVKSLVHANRLKRYISPELRPTNPPEGSDENQDANPELIDDSDVESDQEVNATNDASQSSQGLDDTDSTNRPIVTQQKSGDSASNSLTVDRIICCKPSNKVKWYRVKWKEQRETSWVKEEALHPHLIREFHIQKTQRGTMKKKNRNKKKL